MALSETQRRQIEEEEAYRAEIRGNPKKKKRIGCLSWIIILFLIFLFIGMVASEIHPNKTIERAKSNANPAISEEQKKQAEEKQKQQAQELANLICSERSKPNVRAVNFTDFIAMYEANGKTVLLHPANGVYPTKENCQKIAEICLDMWNAEDCNNIANRKIWIGMTDDQLILSWGMPNDKNNSTYSFGVHSQWVYGDFGPYAYLEGEDKNSLKVTSWQD